MTPLLCQLVDSGKRTLLRRQYGNRELEITWEQNSGRLQGFLYRDGKAISVTLSGLPKRRVPIEELPLVRDYLEGAAIRLHDRHIDIWSRLLGGMDNGSKSEHLNVFISAHSSSQKEVSNLKKRLQDKLTVLDPRPGVGENIREAIHQKVQKSDLVIFFVTRDYLESEDCMYQATLLRSLVLKWKGEQVYRQKMHIICDQEIMRLKKDVIAGARYADECCQNWNEKIREAVGLMNDSTADAQVQRRMVSDYLKKLCDCREEVVPFIKDDVFEKHWLTLEELEQEEFTSLEEKIEKAKSEKRSTIEIYEYTPLLSTFTGREKLLRQMEENLKPTEREKEIHKTKVVVLSGLGGVGKTQLATKFIEDHLKRYRLVWTFDAESNVTLQEGYHKLAQELKLIREDEKTVPPEEILVRVNRWLKASKNHGWLLCFDNADSLEIVKSKKLPQHGGEILITSRPKTHWGNFYPVIEVQEFERAESNNLLEKIIPEEKQKGQVNALAEELGDFPLALDQAGSYIKNNQSGFLNIETYLALFRETKSRLKIWEKEKEQAANRFYPATVATTWEITMEHIRKIFPDSAETLHLCAYLNANGIPQSWLGDWWIEKKQISAEHQLLFKCVEFDEIIKPLVDFSLLYWEKPQAFLRIHRLVQLVTQDNLKEKERGEFIRETLGLVEGKFEFYDNKDLGTWEIGKECLPHAMSITGHILKEKGFLENTDLKEILSTELSPEITDLERATFHKEIFHASEQGKTTLLFHQMASYTLRQGNAFEATEYWTQALEIYKAVFGDSHPSVASTLNNLGAAWSDLGEKKKAIEYYTQALEIYKAVFGDSHPDVASTLNNLGTAWSSLGEKKKAIEYYTQALEIKKTVFGNSHPDVASTLNNLGNAWRSLGENKKAIEYYTQALEIKKAVFGDSHPDVAMTLNNLGTAWSSLGEKKKAIEYYTQALEIKKAVFGDSHPDVAMTLNNLGTAWSSLGENKKAIENHTQALEIFKAFYGDSHPDVARTLSNLGNAWSALGENQKAIEYYTQALEIYKAFYGDSHPDVARTLSNLGNAWSALGENQKAVEYYTQALEISKAFYGDSHPDVAFTLNNLGNAWSALGEKKKAIEYYTQALEIYKAFYGDSHPDVARTLSNLGNAWSALGENQKAVEYYTQALEISKAVFGDSHPDVAMTLNNLGAAWSSLGEKKKAIEYYTQALEIRKAVFGDSHPDVAGTLNNLGNAWSSLGEKKKAIEYYTQALEIKKAVFGDSHPSVASTLNNLGAAWSDLGENKKAIEYYTQALEIKKAVFGDSHPDVAMTLNNLGAAWSDLGEKKKAIEYYTQALEIKKAFYGDSHPDVARTLSNLGNAWSALGENQKAVEYYTQALEISKAVFGDSHPDVAMTLNNLGAAWSSLGENKKAIEYYTQALEIRKAVFGDSHPDVAGTLNNLGTAWSSLGEKKKAIEYYTQALEIYKAVFGDSHPDVAMTLNNLGAAWSSLGEPKKAIEYYTQALEIRKAVFGDSHPDVASTLNNLGNAWSSLGDHQKATQYFTQAYTLFQQFYGEDHPHTQIAKNGLNRAMLQQLLSNFSIEEENNRSSEESFDLSAVDIHEQEMLLAQIHSEQPPTPHLHEEPTFTVDELLEAALQEDLSANEKLQELATQSNPEALEALEFLKEWNLFQ